jgi:cholestenol Delta-isomerase
MGPAQDLFGQLWKEYALSDSRYLTSDPFVLCMETVTAVCLPCFPPSYSFPHHVPNFPTPQSSNKSLTAQTQFTWGPICLLLPFLITNSHPLRHPLQIIVCVGQIYGLILYYATSMFDHYYKEVTYSRPEFLYFWGYYFFMNFIWMVFPGSEFTHLN